MTMDSLLFTFHAAATASVMRPKLFTLNSLLLTPARACGT